MKTEENIYANAKLNDLSDILGNPVFPYWMNIQKSGYEYLVDKVRVSEIPYRS